MGLTLFFVSLESKKKLIHWRFILCVYVYVCVAVNRKKSPIHSYMDWFCNYRFPTLETNNQQTNWSLDLWSEHAQTDVKCTFWGFNSIRCFNFEKCIWEHSFYKNSYVMHYKISHGMVFFETALFIEWMYIFVSERGYNTSLIIINWLMRGT